MEVRGRVLLLWHLCRIASPWRIPRALCAHPSPGEYTAEHHDGGSGKLLLLHQLGAVRPRSATYLRRALVRPHPQGCDASARERDDDFRGDLCGVPWCGRKLVSTAGVFRQQRCLGQGLVYNPCGWNLPDLRCGWKIDAQGAREDGSFPEEARYSGVAAFGLHPGIYAAAAKTELNRSSLAGSVGLCGHGTFCFDQWLVQHSGDDLRASAGVTPRRAA
mmetsp:Transcript_55989/g.131280  ORF Transcript_55989/g.131280 Transcript_55989/m.131280 type:complete len:218 (-) Transcript_55989:313-966(-)